MGVVLGVIHVDIRNHAKVQVERIRLKQVYFIPLIHRIVDNQIISSLLTFSIGGAGFGCNFGALGYRKGVLLHTIALHPLGPLV